MFFPFNFYVFIFGCAGSPLLCGLFSRCRDRDCSLVAMRGLLIMVSPLCCGAWPLGGEGNGTPLQYSCQENPMDGGAWWASVCGVAKSRTQLTGFPFTFHFMHWRRKWQPTPAFLPGESRGRGSLVGCHLWGRTESDTPEVTQ